MTQRAYVGVDVGTGSVRAGVVTPEGRLLGVGTSPIRMWQPQHDFAEQSSDDIWRACGEAIGTALREADVTASAIAGVGFDATCSLVALGPDDGPVTVSPTGKDEQNVVVWMDHRATDQAERINAGGHDVLRYVGGVISPEMQTPKLLWLRESLPETWKRAARFLDLPDFLSYRATGVDVRSLCTTVCKWTYLGHEQDEDGSEGRWDESYFRDIGLGDLADEGFARIGRRIRPMGERAGTLTEQAAGELGLTSGTPVAVSIIDAHAGGIGLLGAPLGGRAPDESSFDRRLALIGGTSTCHMAVSGEPRFIDGIWGPYWSAMIPGMWLTEGGQSATGALVDHVIGSHARGQELSEAAEREGRTVYELLNERLAALAESRGLALPAELTRDLHVFPDFHGNRSPRADPSLRGMVSGLSLADDLDALAVLYLATVQAVAHGTRHVIDRMNAAGYRVDTIVATGGGTKNPVFLREHADVTGCRIALPREGEAVLLGAAVLGAVASGDHPTIAEAMAAMDAAGEVVEPTGDAASRYHAAKHEVFHRMHDDQMAYRAIMHK